MAKNLVIQLLSSTIFKMNQILVLPLFGLQRKKK